MKENEIEFIGKITAGVTHEVNNVLASIREISGLLADILSTINDNSFAHKEKFESSLQKIQNQVQRGVRLSNQLNKFSHLTDNDNTEFDLNDLIEHLIFLTERFAGIKNIELQMLPSAQSVKINSYPLLLQMALFNCISFLLNQLESGSKLTINPEKNENQYSINIFSNYAVKDDSLLFKEWSSSPELLSLHSVMERLNGVYKINEAGNGINLNMKSLDY